MGPRASASTSALHSARPLCNAAGAADAIERQRRGKTGASDQGDVPAQGALDGAARRLRGATRFRRIGSSADRDGSKRQGGQKSGVVAEKPRQEASSRTSNEANFHRTRGRSGEILRLSAGATRAHRQSVGSVRSDTRGCGEASVTRGPRPRMKKSEQSEGAACRGLARAAESEPSNIALHRIGARGARPAR